MNRTASAFVMIGLGLLWPATGCDDDPQPEEAATSEQPQLEVGGSDEEEMSLAPPGKLARALPRARRNSKYGWGRRSRLVPGHLGAHLVYEETDQSVMTVTIDDLAGDAERLERMRSLEDRYDGHPADIARGNWIRALVADRFEVAVRASSAPYRDHGRLKSWFDRLDLGELRELKEALSETQ